MAWEASTFSLHRGRNLVGFLHLPSRGVAKLAWDFLCDSTTYHLRKRHFWEVCDTLLAFTCGHSSFSFVCSWRRRVAGGNISTYYEETCLYLLPAEQEDSSRLLPPAACYFGSVLTPPGVGAGETLRAASRARYCLALIGGGCSARAGRLKERDDR